MKKMIITLFIFIIIINISNYIYADDEEQEIIDNSWIYEEIGEVNTSICEEPIINSRAGVIYDRTTGDVIWGKNEKDKRAMASTTKIMTAIIVLENAKDLNETVLASKKAAGIGGSRLGLSTNSKITVNDLLYGLMLKSGNDCAIALAEYVGNTVDNFAEMMNNKAKELGLKNTHFVTVNGLDNENHYTTAIELAKLTDYALKNEKFAEIVRTKSYTVTLNGYGKAIGNTNELLGYLNGVYGVKTGFTNGANRCLVTAVKRENMDLICVVLGADTKKDRTRDSVKMIEYAYANYKMYSIEKKIEEAYNNWIISNKIEIIKGKEKFLETEIKDYKDKMISIKKENENEIEVYINAINSLEAPIKEGTKIGEIKVRVGNEIKATIDIISKREVKKKNQKDYFFEILGNVNEYYKKM